MKLKILAIAYHRNGVGGAPFHVVLFDDRCNDGRRMMAIVFDERAHCAVLDIVLLHAGDIAFGLNSFRGDNYEPYLRLAINEYQTKGK